MKNLPPDDKDILLAYIERQWSQAKQSEDQRTSAINVTLIVVGGLQSYIIEREFDRHSIPLAILIIISALYGLLICMKYYERFRLACSRVGRAVEKLTILYPNINLDQIEADADAKHKEHFPHFQKIRLNHMWICFLTTLTLWGFIDLWIISSG